MDIFLKVAQWLGILKWEEVTECVTCPLKYKTGSKSMCNLGIGEIPPKGISRNCPVIKSDTRLMGRRRRHEN